MHILADISRPSMPFKCEIKRQPSCERLLKLHNTCSSSSDFLFYSN